MKQDFRSSNVQHHFLYIVFDVRPLSLFWSVQKIYLLSRSLLVF
nr:MAG TPA: hypothetical protein [Inoviridae sp.]